MDMLQVFINKCLQKIVNIIWREINTNYNLWNTNWRAGDDESENERAKHCPLSFYTSQQRRYNGLACRADYSIFTRQWTCPPMGKSMLTQEWTRPPVVSVLAYSHSGWTTDEPVLSPDRHYDGLQNLHLRIWRSAAKHALMVLVNFVLELEVNCYLGHVKKCNVM